MKKKTSFPMIARRIIPGILCLWLLTVILVTLNNTADIRDNLYDSAAGFTDYLCRKELEPFFTKDDPRYGRQYENPPQYEYAMLSTVLDCSLISGSSGTVSWSSLLDPTGTISYRSYSVPVPRDQPQLIQGIRRRHGLGDYLYANQRCQE